MTPIGSGFLLQTPSQKEFFFCHNFAPRLLQNTREQEWRPKINCHDFISFFPKYPIPSKTTALDPAAKGWTSFLTVSWQFFSFQLDKSSSLAHNSCVGYDKKDLNNFYLFMEDKEWKKSFFFALIISYFFFLSFFSGSHQPLGMEPRSYLRDEASRIPSFFTRLSRCASLPGLNQSRIFFPIPGSF